MHVWPEGKEFHFMITNQIPSSQLLNQILPWKEKTSPLYEWWLVNSRFFWKEGINGSNEIELKQRKSQHLLLYFFETVETICQTKQSYLYNKIDALLLSANILGSNQRAQPPPHLLQQLVPNIHEGLSNDIVLLSPRGIESLGDLLN